MTKERIIKLDGKKYRVHKSEPASCDVVYSPFTMTQSSEEENRKSDEFRKKYYEAHKCCPKCGSRNYISTLVGYILDMSKPEEYKDRNSVHCQDCGWRGIYHDLVPETK